VNLPDYAAGAQLLWLLLPLTAACTWWLARSPVRQRTAPRVRARRPRHAYTEQPDAGVEAFMRTLESESGTEDTQLTLGSLLRRRGVVDHAIRIHQGLIARPYLSAEQRARALHELAWDYLRSGLLDRAENLFHEVIAADTPHTAEALSGLLDIYQQEHDWQRAIDTARRLQQHDGRSLGALIAQFHCEQAEVLLKRARHGEAAAALRRALRADAHCARAAMIEARVLHEQGRLSQALRAYREVEQRQPELLTEVAEPLLACYRELHRLEQGRDYLQAAYRRHGDATVLLVLTRLIAESEGEHAAFRFLAGELKYQPSIDGMEWLLSYIAGQVDAPLSGSLLGIGGLLGGLARQGPTYRCRHCGLGSHTLHWRCPGCHQWDIVRRDSLQPSSSDPPHA